jgi:hypothetical protein
MRTGYVFRTRRVVGFSKAQDTEGLLMSSASTGGQKLVSDSGSGMTIVEAGCVHCGSARIQEARRAAGEITFRCLHCWKTFTQPVGGRSVAPTCGDTACPRVVVHRASCVDAACESQRSEAILVPQPQARGSRVPARHAPRLDDEASQEDREPRRICKTAMPGSNPGGASKLS